MSTTPQPEQLGSTETDQHLDAVLKASGSALRHYSLPISLDKMRAAMRAHEAAVVSRVKGQQTTHKPLPGHESAVAVLEGLGYVYRGCGIWQAPQQYQSP